MSSEPTLLLSLTLMRNLRDEDYAYGLGMNTQYPLEHHIMSMHHKNTPFIVLTPLNPTVI